MSAVSFTLLIVGTGVILVLIADDEPNPGIASLGVFFYTHICAFVLLMLSFASTLTAALFRKPSLWLLVLQFPAFGYFALFWYYLRTQ